MIMLYVMPMFNIELMLTKRLITVKRPVQRLVVILPIEGDADA